jgi:hypothetical protein
VSEPVSTPLPHDGHVTRISFYGELDHEPKMRRGTEGRMSSDDTVWKIACCRPHTKERSFFALQSDHFLGSLSSLDRHILEAAFHCHRNSINVSSSVPSFSSSSSSCCEYSESVQSVVNHPLTNEKGRNKTTATTSVSFFSKYGGQCQ